MEELRATEPGRELLGHAAKSEFAQTYIANSTDLLLSAGNALRVGVAGGAETAVKAAAGRFPGARKVVDLIANYANDQLSNGADKSKLSGMMAEFAAGTAISTTGLFAEVGSAQNKSNWGVDFLTKTHDGEWVSWEMKANTSGLSRNRTDAAGTMRYGQRAGATAYTNQKLGEATSGYRNWKNTDESVIEFAERVQVEQAQYNERNGRNSNHFDGFVVRTKDVLNKEGKLNTTIKAWK